MFNFLWNSLVLCKLRQHRSRAGKSDPKQKHCCSIWHRNSHSKATKTETSKYCIWTVRQNLETKLTFWASSFNLLWKSVVLFKLHQCGLMRVECTLYNHCCCSKASNTQRTNNPVVKFSVSFFCLFCFKMKRKLWKKAFFHFRQETMALVQPFGWEFSKKLAFKNR